MTEGCLVCGARVEPESRFCRPCWFALPLKVRQQYWRETDYGRLVPSPGMAEIIRGGMNG